MPNNKRISVMHSCEVAKAHFDPHHSRPVLKEIRSHGANLYIHLEPVFLTMNQLVVLEYFTVEKICKQSYFKKNNKLK